MSILYKSQKDVLFAFEIKKFITHVKALNLLLAVLHKLFVKCFVKVSLWSMVIPRNFSLLVLFIVYYLL